MYKKEKRQNSIEHYFIESNTITSGILINKKDKF